MKGGKILVKQGGRDSTGKNKIRGTVDRGRKSVKAVDRGNLCYHAIAEGDANEEQRLEQC
jgi:hypothetical protein